MIGSKPLNISIIKEPFVKMTFPKEAVGRISQVGVLATTFLPVSVFAAGDTSCDPKSANISDAAKCSQAPNSQPSSLFGTGGIFQTISEVLIFLVGAVSVIMLIWGGLQYVISAGDSKRVEGAKNTLLYAIIGIVVAILAYAVVGFVTASLTPSSDGGS
jgi:hypothetical protein